MSYQSNSVEWLLLVLICSLLVGLSVEGGSSDCQRIQNCQTDCVVGSSNFQPQRCDKCCPGTTGSRVEDPMSNRQAFAELAAVKSDVSSLMVMNSVLLALVLLMIVAMAGMYLHVTERLPRCLKFLLFMKKKEAEAKKEKSPQTNCNGVSANTVVNRLANHQSTSSPQTKRASFTKSSPDDLPSLESQHTRPFRVRQPSESTCPEEGNNTDITPQGYDNLALSTSTIDTSTLHNTSNSSTDTLGPTLSTTTLHTTLSSDHHHLHSNGHHNTRV